MPLKKKPTRSQIVTFYQDSIMMSIVFFFFCSYFYSGQGPVSQVHFKPPTTLKGHASAGFYIV